MAELSICTTMAPGRAALSQSYMRDMILGKQSPHFVAEDTSSAWAELDVETILQKFDEQTKVTLFISPTGVVGYYNVRKLKVDVRDGKVWGTFSSHSGTQREVELPHLQVQGVVTLKWYKDFIAARHRGAHLVAPNEYVYLRIEDNLARLQPAMPAAIPHDPQTVGGVSFYLSRQGTVTNTHLDMHSGLIFQVKGRKRVLLFPPYEIPRFALHPIGHIFARRSKYAEKLTQDCLARHPDLASARGYECVIAPNQWLYIPAFWLHHVETLDDDTVSIISRFRK